MYGQAIDSADAQYALKQGYPSYVISKDSIFWVQRDSSGYSCPR